MQSLNEDQFTRDFFNKRRKLDESISKKQTINEESGEDQVVIDPNDEYTSQLKSNITKFVGSVKTDENGMIVYPSQGDVVFNGVITDMNNTKFQFRYNDQSGGLYIWSDALLLTKDVADKLSKLVAIKGQWKDYWAENISNY